MTGIRIRPDLLVTLILSDPDEYDAGELIVEGHAVKLPAVHLVLYPANSLNMVTPITRGVRVASFFWLQSMIRDAQARRLILDTAIQGVADRMGRYDPQTLLTGVSHNLVRYWAER